MAASLLLFLVIFLAASACVQSADFVLTVVPGSSSSQFSTQRNESFWRTVDFTLGFKRLADANEYLLCIWRSADLDQTALWWPSTTDFNRTALLLSQSLGNNGNGTGTALIESPAVVNGTVFRFTSDGRLQLIFEGGAGQTDLLVLWSVRSNASLAELQNTGNLLLRDANNITMWQSFGDRRDTMILPAGPGSSADVNLVANNSRLLQSRSSSNQSSASYAPGRFHVETDGYPNLYLHAVEEYYGVDFIYSYGAINVSGYFTISKGGRRYNSNASMGMSLVKLDPDSNIRVYVWSETVLGWNQTWEMLERRCFLANACGPFGICTEINDGSSVDCSCPPGYSFLDPLDASKGCRSADNVNFTTICGDASNSSGTYAAAAYTMTEVVDSDYDYGDIGTSHSVSGVTECGQLCLQLCECVAASFVVSGDCYLKGNKSGGILMNGYTTDSNALLIKNIVESSSAQGSNTAAMNNTAAIVGGLVGGFLVLVGVATAVLCAVRRNRSRGRWRFGPAGGLLLDMDEGSGETGPAIKFTRQQLVKATDNFRYLLGEGGFGNVYKGWIKQKKQERGEKERSSGNRGQLRRNRSQTKTTTTVVNTVAVKVLKMPPAAGGGAVADDGVQVGADAAALWGRGARATRQFRAEVNTLGKIHHINLVNLIGYCDGDDDTVEGRQMRALVFEFMERGSLERYLYGKPKNKKNGEAEAEELSWERRYSIALGVAHGIAYLHHECSPPILHSDIKPQNVLLDGNFSAKVADFGFARRFQETKSHLTMSVMHGTRGYMAPEWLRTDEITSKVDVYSFGVVLLELVRGLCESYRQLLLDRNDGSDLDVDLPLFDWAFRYLQGFPPSTTREMVTEHPDPSTTKANKEDASTNDADGDSDSSNAMKKKREIEESAGAGHERSELQQPMMKKMSVLGEIGEGSETERSQKTRLLKIGLWCVQYAPQVRPSMQQVLRLMEEVGSGGGEIEMPPYPGPNLAGLPAPFLDESGCWRDDSDSFVSSNDLSSNTIEAAYSVLSAR